MTIAIQSRFVIIFLQVSDDGNTTTVEKPLKPFENLSLHQFIKETENVSECDVIQITDDEQEDLPKDNVKVVTKVLIRIIKAVIEIP